MLTIVLALQVFHGVLHFPSHKYTTTTCPTCGEGESTMPLKALVTYPKHLPKVRISKAEGNVRHMKSLWSGFALGILTALCL